MIETKKEINTFTLTPPPCCQIGCDNDVIVTYFSRYRNK